MNNKVNGDVGNEVLKWIEGRKMLKEWKEIVMINIMWDGRIERG